MQGLTPGSGLQNSHSVCLWPRCPQTHTKALGHHVPTSADAGQLLTLDRCAPGAARQRVDFQKCWCSFRAQLTGSGTWLSPAAHARSHLLGSLCTDCPSHIIGRLEPALASHCLLCTVSTSLPSPQLSALYNPTVYYPVPAECPSTPQCLVCWLSHGPCPPRLR